MACKHLHIEASTEHDQERKYIPIGSFAVFNDCKPYYYKDFQIEALEGFHLYLPLKRENELVGLLALKERVPGSFEKIISEEGEAVLKRSDENLKYGDTYFRDYE